MNTSLESSGTVGMVRRPWKLAPPVYLYADRHEVGPEDHAPVQFDEADVIVGRGLGSYAAGMDLDIHLYKACHLSMPDPFVAESC